MKIEATPLDPLTAADGFGGFLSTIFVVAAAGAWSSACLPAGRASHFCSRSSPYSRCSDFSCCLELPLAMSVSARVCLPDVLKAAADATEDPQMVTNTDGNVLYSNQAFETMFGRSDAGPRDPSKSPSAATRRPPKHCSA